MAQSTSAIRAGRAFVEVFADNDPLTKGLRRSEAILRRFGNRVNVLGRSLILTGAKLAVPFVVAGRAFAQFEFLMRRTQILSRATGDEFEKLEKRALKLGRSTIFTAKDTAEAMNFFALAGFEANKIFTIITPTLDLAAAGMLDVGSAADIAVKVMASMQIEATKVGEAIDILTLAMTTANTDLRMLGDAFKFTGPVAQAAGQSLAEITAAIQVLSNAGVQGQLAGTTLRGAIIRLASPTKEAAGILKRLGVAVNDAAGNMAPFSDIISQLEAGLAGLGTGERIGLIGRLFPLRQASGIAALIAQGGVDLKRRVVALQNATGTAARIAREQIDTLKGDFIIMISALTGLAIDLGEVINKTVRGWIKLVINVSNITAEFVKANRGLFIIGVKLSVALIGVGGALLGLAVGLKLAAFAMVPFAVATSLLAKAFIPLVVGVGLLAKGLGLLLVPLKLINLPLLILSATSFGLLRVFKKLLFIPLVFSKRIAKLVTKVIGLRKVFRGLWRGMKLLVKLPLAPFILLTKLVRIQAKSLTVLVAAWRAASFTFSAVGVPFKLAMVLMRGMTVVLQILPAVLLALSGALSVVGVALGVLAGIALVRFLIGIGRALVTTAKFSVVLGTDLVRAAGRAKGAVLVFGESFLRAGKSVRKGLGMMFDDIKIFAKGIVRVVGEQYNVVVALLTQGRIEQAFGLIWVNLEIIAIAGFNLIAGLWNSFLDGLRSAIPKLVLAFRQAWNFVVFFAKTAFADIQFSFRTFVKELKADFVDFLNSMSNLFNTLSNIPFFKGKGFGGLSDDLAKLAGQWESNAQAAARLRKELDALFIKRRGLQRDLQDPQKSMVSQRRLTLADLADVGQQISAKQARIAGLEDLIPFDERVRDKKLKDARDAYDKTLAVIAKDMEAFDPFFAKKMLDGVQGVADEFARIVTNALKGVIDVNTDVVDNFLESLTVAKKDLSALEFERIMKNIQAAAILAAEALAQAGKADRKNLRISTARAAAQATLRGAAQKAADKLAEKQARDRRKRWLEEKIGILEQPSPFEVGPPTAKEFFGRKQRVIAAQRALRDIQKVEAREVRNAQRNNEASRARDVRRAKSAAEKARREAFRKSRLGQLGANIEEAARGAGAAFRQAFIISSPLQFAGAESGGALEVLKSMDEGIDELVRQGQDDEGLVFTGG